MDNLIEEHAKLKKLVETGVLIPGIYTGNIGNIKYTPISQEEYLERISKGYIQGLGYNTRTMGRGIFTLNNSGKIINFKGVDSHLENKDSLAVQTTEATIDNLTAQNSYGINIIHFVDRNNKNPDGKLRLEFRIKGASQYQNLLVEKLKRDDIQQRDSKKLVKLPDFDIPKPLSDKMCETYSLPRVLEITDEFLGSIEPGSYAEYCLIELKKQNIDLTHRNQLWQEYFEEYYPEKLQDVNLLATIQKEDQTYGLGAIFAQTTRKLDNPFRIMELQEYIKNNDSEAVRAIIEYSQSKCGGELLEDYAKISAKNAAGFMNLNLSINNFEHRQDYPLSGEICDDAYDDVTNSITTSNPNPQDHFNRLKFYNQVYLFASNIKVIEDAYRMLGKEIPQNYQVTFLETFYESLDDNTNFKLCFRNENPMEQLSLFNNAGKNFSGMEDYVTDLRQKAVEVYKSKQAILQNKTTDTNDDNDER